MDDLVQACVPRSQKRWTSVSGLPTWKYNGEEYHKLETMAY